MSRWQARTTGGARVAIVGRPNVGKSTLVNRIAGRRDAIVQEKPGVTRDRSTHAAEWIGRDFTLIDTGGWTPGWAPDRTTMDELVSLQAEIATTEADLVLFVVDATVGITSEDEAVAKWLRTSGIPVMLIANKADTLSEVETASVLGELYALGLGDPTTMSALHGHGSGDLLDEVVTRLRDSGAFDRPPETDDGVPGIALIGRPNVGKSSLFNRLVGQDRVIVDEVPGTTRDPIDTLLDVQRDDGEVRTYRFIDTAGLRKKTAKLDSTEFYSTVRTRKTLERASVALLLLDSAQSIGEQEQRLAREIIDSGRAVVLVQNKWDLVDTDRRLAIAKERDRLLQFLDFAPTRRISALTGRSVSKLFGDIDRVLDAWNFRVPTGRLNQWLSDAVAATPPPLGRNHRPVKIRYVTQVDTQPPRFKLFTNQRLEPAYLRYLERRLRERFGFDGTPLRLDTAIRTNWEDRDPT
ncbi:ribosome biogenesis GTPase Der [Euzebya tangerina]|uniref:ribosome biogenesis GTPase Der n=1 Tax=Euzebya tangerina TaxID=591198 RepID=UPI000E30FF15|nr:ribosome biogenesis GTPase Der [Euzebya tangerina]